MDLIKMRGGYVAHAWYEKKWSVETEGWVWYRVSKKDTLPIQMATNDLPYRFRTRGHTAGRRFQQ